MKWCFLLWVSFACKIGVVGFMGLVFGKWNEIFFSWIFIGLFFPLFSEMVFVLSSDWVFIYLFIGFGHSFWY